MAGGCGSDWRELEVRFEGVRTAVDALDGGVRVGIHAASKKLLELSKALNSYILFVSEGFEGLVC